MRDANHTRRIKLARRALGRCQRNTQMLAERSIVLNSAEYGGQATALTDDFPSLQAFLREHDHKYVHDMSSIDDILPPHGNVDTRAVCEIAHNVYKTNQEDGLVKIDLLVEELLKSGTRKDIVDLLRYEFATIDFISWTCLKVFITQIVDRDFPRAMAWEVEPTLDEKFVSFIQKMCNRTSVQDQPGGIENFVVASLFFRELNVLPDAQYYIANPIIYTGTEKLLSYQGVIHFLGKEGLRFLRYTALAGRLRKQAHGKSLCSREIILGKKTPDAGAWIDLRDFFESQDKNCTGKFPPSKIRSLCASVGIKIRADPRALSSFTRDGYVNYYDFLNLVLHHDLTCPSRMRMKALDIIAVHHVNIAAYENMPRAQAFAQLGLMQLSPLQCRSILRYLEMFPGGSLHIPNP